MRNFTSWYINYKTLSFVGDYLPRKQIALLSDVIIIIVIIIIISLHCTI